MMNVLTRNPTARRNRNVITISDIPGVFQDMIHRMQLLFLQLWYMINRKPPSWMTQVTWSTLVDCLRAGRNPRSLGFLAQRQSTRVIRSLGSSTRAVFLLYHFKANEMDFWFWFCWSASHFFSLICLWRSWWHFGCWCYQEYILCILYVFVCILFHWCKLFVRGVQVISCCF
jgi:hypothetical protein